MVMVIGTVESYVWYLDGDGDDDDHHRVMVIGTGVYMITHATL